MPLTFKELKEFTVQQLATLKKEYEPMRGKTISIDNAKKMSNMLDKMTKDMLKKLANADIPFISTGASSKLVIKHGMKPADIKETINLEEADELQQEACWTGYKQVGFKKSSRTGKRVPNCVPESVAREMKEEDLKEYKDYLEYMCKDAGQARTIARMFANKVGDGEVTASGSQVTVDSAKDVESVHKQVMAKYGDDVRVIADEELEEAMSSRKLDNLFIQKGRMQMAKDKQGEKLTDLEIEKEMKRLGIQQPLAASVSEAKLPVGASLRGQHIALKMKKSPTMKDFAPKVAKMANVTIGDLEDILPDYISGADISKLFNETPMMSMNKLSPEYKQGQQAAKKGIKYIDNPHSDAQKKLNWSGGHNAYRMMNMSEERTYTVVHVKHGKEVVKANGTYDAAKKYAQMKGLKDTSGVDAHLMEEKEINKLLEKSINLNIMETLESEFSKDKDFDSKTLMKMSLNEGIFKKILQSIHDKLEKEGGAAGFDDLKQQVKREFGIDITKDTLKNMPGVRQHRDGDYILEADLSKSQIKMVHKKADDMPKKDFIKRYGKDGDSVRFATATNMVKKKLGIEEEEFNPDLKEFTTITGKGIKYDNEKQGWFDEKGKRVYLGKTDAIKLMRKDLDRKKRTGDWVTPYDLSKEQTEKGDNMNEATYKDKFKAAMKDFGINSLDDLKSDADKKKFFKHVDGMHTAKNEELIKEYGTDSQGNDGGMLNAEIMKKEMMKKMEMMKAEKDPEKMEMMKKEMMKEMGKMPEMMKKEMMKKMEMAMKEGFASDAQRKAAFASGYKEKGKKKKEEVELEESLPGSIFNFERQFKDKNKDAMVMMTKGNYKGRVFVIDKDKLPMMQRQGAVQVEDKNEAVIEMMKMNAMKMPIKSSYMKSKKEMKTGDDDMTPDALKLNAMVKDPHKSKEDKPMKDMNAMYMKSDVRADVKNNGGADMAKVKDAPKMQTAMKKINATYGESNIISASTRTFNERSKDMKYLKTKPGSIEEAYLLARGLGEKSLTEAKFKYEMDIDTGAKTQLVYGDISANTEAEAQKKYDKLEADMEKKHRNATIEGGVFDGKNTTTTTGRGTATRKNI